MSSDSERQWRCAVAISCFSSLYTVVQRYLLAHIMRFPPLILSVFSAILSVACPMLPTLPQLPDRTIPPGSDYTSMTTMEISSSTNVPIRKQLLVRVKSIILIVLGSEIAQTSMPKSLSVLAIVLGVVGGSSVLILLIAYTIINWAGCEHHYILLYKRSFNLFYRLFWSCTKPRTTSLGR